MGVSTRTIAGLIAATIAIVLLVGLFPRNSASAQAERRIALVIGESRYQHVPNLPNTVNDARLIAETLRGIGFTLVGGKPYLDPAKPEFEEAIRSFRRELSSAAVGLFYYAGHGFQVDGVNYLVPLNANPTQRADTDFELIDANLILRQMDGAGARLNIVILDACRNNPFLGNGMRGTGGGLAQMSSPKGTLISYATAPGKVALDGKAGGNGPYALALAEAMKKPGHDVFQVFNDVGIIVDRLTDGEQRPWLSSSPIEGDFYFVNRPSQPPLSQPAPPQDNGAPVEIAFWESVRNSDDRAAIQAYLERYPNGSFASLARARLDALAAVMPKPPGPTRSALGSFDGIWKGVVTCGPTAATTGESRRGMPLTVDKGEISGSGHGDYVSNGRRGQFSDDFQGHIEADGTAVITGTGSSTWNGKYGIRFQGKVKDDGELVAEGYHGNSKCNLNYRRD